MNKDVLSFILRNKPESLRIIEPLHSRCGVYEFGFPSKAQATACAGAFMKRAEDVLEKENITYDKSTVANLIMKHMPDWRRVLNELQRYSIANGSIDEQILVKVKRRSDNKEFVVDLDWLKATDKKSKIKHIGPIST